jgi:L-fuculose-phosphate aldolase
METIEHFARISLVARQLGREHLLSREEVKRLQGLRDRYGITAPAPICPDPGGSEDPSCQVVVSPSAPGERLVPDTSVADGPGQSLGTGGEVRLTYAQLTTLIDEAVRQVLARR